MPTNTPEIINSITSTENSVELIDLINMTQSIASLNALYLGISMGAFLGVAVLLFGIFYIFNLKPLQEKITKQEKELLLQKKDNEARLERLTVNIRESQEKALERITEQEKEFAQEKEEERKELGKLKESIATEQKSALEKITEQGGALELEKEENKKEFEKITSNIETAQKKTAGDIEKLKDNLLKKTSEASTDAEKRLGEVENSARREFTDMRHKANTVEMRNIWDSHYLWSIGSTQVHLNELMVLTSYLKKSIAYGFFIAKEELCLTEMSRCLDDISKEPAGAQNKEAKKGSYDELINALEKLDGHNEEKAQLVNKAKNTLLED